MVNRRTPTYVAVLGAAMLVTVSACSASTPKAEPTPTGISPSASATPQDVPTSLVPVQEGPTLDGDPSTTPSVANSSVTPITPSASTSAPSSPPPAPPSVVAAAADIQSVAAGFLTIRENQVSWNQKTVDSWLAQVKPAMTEKGFGALSATINPKGSPGSTWSMAHAQGIGTKVNVGKCVVNLASGVDTPTRKFIQCPVVDTPVDKTGKPLPTPKIPPMWPYAGAQSNALLEMVKQGDKWYVQADWTGKAS